MRGHKENRRRRRRAVVDENVRLSSRITLCERNHYDFLEIRNRFVS